jgi:hypothetical protein
MKKFVLVALAAALFLGIGIQNASADNSLKQGALSLGIAVAAPISNPVTASSSAIPVVQGKYMLTKDLGLLAGLGFAAKGGDLDGTDLEMYVGARKYLKVADVAPFAGAKIAYDSRDDGATEVSFFTVAVELGAEAFLLKQFSIEGSVGFGYVTGDSKTAGVKRDGSSFGTTSAGVSVNYYF